MDFQEQNVAGGSFIATKQRIAAGSAKSPTEPVSARPTAGTSAIPAKSTPAAAKAGPSSITTENRPALSLKNLSFKKKSNKDATDNFSPTTSVANTVSSPDVDTHGVNFSYGSTTASKEPPRPVQLPRRSTLQTSPVDTTAADKFLSTIMPSALAAPMNEDQHDIPPTPVAGPSSSATARVIQPPPVLTRIPKKWKWSGELFMTVAHDKTEKMCNIILSEPTEPRPMGLRLNICLDQVKSIQLQKLHVISDLNMVLLACAPVQQFCKITPQETQDADGLRTLDEYLRKRSSFTYAHIHLDDIPAAILIVFPNTHAQISKVLNVPQYLRDEYGLIGALVPWKLSTEEYQKNRWTKPRESAESKEPLVDPALVKMDKQKISRKPPISRGLRLNKFPKVLHELLTVSKRKAYCIWFTPSDGNAKRPGLETSSLQAILKEYDAKDVGYKTDVNFIFIHVGALHTMHHIPAIGMRRSKQPQLQFFTYGTHSTVPPERWGLRQVYPLGGIATFAPSAILGDIFGVRSFIKKLDEHPLWETFIPPHILGGIVKLACQEADPLALWDEGNFYLFELFEFIEEGKLALLTAPPLARRPAQSKTADKKWDDPTTAWISSQIKILPMNARELLAHCMQAFHERYPNFNTTTLQSRLTKDLIQETRDMQYQPRLMDEYRRFVVFQDRIDKETDETETVNYSSIHNPRRSYLRISYVIARAYNDLGFQVQRQFLPRSRSTRLISMLLDHFL
ncbi:hypothetical protein K474DRAFT_1282466 [Panus rudis PR-1116 ss-1]|nr:hypothetical protein K474DRAFT_1282466 [Panus rudis PR-1116 ss-1]